MSRICQICGKGGTTGNMIARRGRPKYLGGVGVKTTGVTKRRFKPNLQRVNVSTANGTHKALLVCTQCIRSGGITKVVRAAPFKVPHDPTKATAKAKAKK